MTVVLDSWSILRYLEGIAPAAQAVDDLLGDERPFVSWVNVGEVFHVVRRRHGEEAASDTVRDLRGVARLELPTELRVIEAARIKADNPMSYADAFAAATAMAHGATLWTGDPALLRVGAAWQWRDLRG